MQIKITLPDELEEALKHVRENTDAIVAKTLQAGGEVVAAELKKQLKAVLKDDPEHTKRQTGQLLNSIGVTPAKITRNGDATNVKVGFNEPRKEGENTSNAMLANVIDHGKSNQKARPFLSKTKRNSKEPAEKKMIEVFDAEVAKL